MRGQQAAAKRSRPSAEETCVTPSEEAAPAATIRALPGNGQLHSGAAGDDAGGDITLTNGVLRLSTQQGLQFCDVPRGRRGQAVPGGCRGLAVTVMKLKHFRLSLAVKHHWLNRKT